MSVQADEPFYVTVFELPPHLEFRIVCTLDPNDSFDKPCETQDDRAEGVPVGRLCARTGDT